MLQLCWLNWLADLFCSGFLREYEAEYKNRKEELSRVRARLTEQQDKQRLTRDAIDEAHEAAEAIRDCTESEAERLARELQQQEKLHGWKLKRLDGRVLEMVLENRVEVRFDISPTTGSLKTLRLQPAKGSTFDIFEEFTSEALSRKLVAESHTLESEWKVNEVSKVALPFLSSKLTKVRVGHSDCHGRLGPSTPIGLDARSPHLALPDRCRHVRWADTPLCDRADAKSEVEGLD